MADISKCDGEGCIRKNTCYRYLVKADKWQSYLLVPAEERGINCKVYWEDEYGTTNLWSNSDR